MSTPPTTPPGQKGKSSLPPWLRDKRVQLGIAAAAGLGLVVMLRRGGAGGITGGEESSGTPIEPAQFDSSGVDAYNAIQSVGAAWTTELRTLAQQLADIQSKLDSEPTGTGGGTTPGRWTTPGNWQQATKTAPRARAAATRTRGPVGRVISWRDRVVNWPPRRTAPR